MGFFIFVLVAAAVAAGVIGVLRWNRQRLEQRDRLFTTFARHADWHYRRNPVRDDSWSNDPETRFEFEFEGGPADARWTMRLYPARRQRGDAEPQAIATAVWRCFDLGAARTAFMILPRWQYRLETGKVVGTIEQLVSAFVDVVNETESSENRQAFFRRATEVKGTLPGFDEAYAVLAGPELPQWRLTEEVQALLLRWAMLSAQSTKPSLLLHARLDMSGLCLSFQRPAAQSWPFWSQFGRLGEALAANLGPAARR